jgi:hypothetical protein
LRRPPYCMRLLVIGGEFRRAKCSWEIRKTNSFANL